MTTDDQADGLLLAIDVTAAAEVIPGPARLAHDVGECGPDCDICTYEHEHGSGS